QPGPQRPSRVPRVPLLDGAQERPLEHVLGEVGIVDDVLGEQHESLRGRVEHARERVDVPESIAFEGVVEIDRRSGAPGHAGNRRDTPLVLHPDPDFRGTEPLDASHEDEVERGRNVLSVVTPTRFLRRSARSSRIGSPAIAVQVNTGRTDRTPGVSPRASRRSRYALRRWARSAPYLARSPRSR